MDESANAAPSSVRLSCSTLVSPWLGTSHCSSVSEMYRAGVGAAEPSWQVIGCVSGGGKRCPSTATS